MDGREPILQDITRPSAQAPPFGVFGLRPGTKEVGRVDFRPESLEVPIESKGQRLAWSRAAQCPCEPINNQTDQSDPNCKLCAGRGILWFGDTTPQNLTSESLTDIQRTILRAYNAFLIRGLLLSVGKSDKPWDKLGPFRTGTAAVTVRAQNKLGFMDRLINIDGALAYHEVLDMPEDQAAPLATRYFITGGVHLLRSRHKRFYAGQDFVVQDGKISFLNQAQAPTPKTRLALHYITCPTWLVQDMPHATRITNVSPKLKGGESPEGSVYEMPIQAMLRLEFLPPLQAAPDGA